MNDFQYKDGELHAEDASLIEIAAQYSTPTFVYSSAAIKRSYQQFETAFAGQDHLICYAVKANSNIGILGLLAGLGSGFDIVSGGELERVLVAGGDPNKIIFSGVGKQAWEIEAALKAGIACFNLESASELQLISRSCSELQKTARISVRVNPDVDPKTHPYIATGLKESKFGVSPGEALMIYEQANTIDCIEITGIDFHIGSQITELSPFADALARVLELVDELSDMGIELKHIDLGGGIGITYKDEEPLHIDEYASCISQMMAGRAHQLVFEPGRVIVGNAGILLSRVITIKESEDTNFAVLDAAMNDLIRPALYQSWQDIKNVRQTDKAESIYDVVGPICESADFLAKNRSLALDEGDLVAIYSSGAYGFAMSSNYNSRSRAAELIVIGSDVHCVRKRETFEDQIRLETILPN
ncbi:MAG: diaminopimelate decarboxylase [Pseudomonadales bacterium]